MALMKKGSGEPIHPGPGVPQNESVEHIEPLLELINSPLEPADDWWDFGFGKFWMKERETLTAAPTAKAACLIENETIPIWRSFIRAFYGRARE
ncbi:hypothetical protein [Desulfosarcina sp.]|uniref:hypothetical protein n=1 Tax=Desulfosarcina sp. TaxID=2027861 RepID=UPI003565060A